MCCSRLPHYQTHRVHTQHHGTDRYLQTRPRAQLLFNLSPVRQLTCSAHCFSLLVMCGLLCCSGTGLLLNSCCCWCGCTWLAAVVCSIADGLHVDNGTCCRCCHLPCLCTAAGPGWMPVDPSILLLCCQRPSTACWLAILSASSCAFATAAADNDSDNCCYRLWATQKLWPWTQRTVVALESS